MPEFAQVDERVAPAREARSERRVEARAARSRTRTRSSGRERGRRLVARVGDEEVERTARRRRRRRRPCRRTDPPLPRPRRGSRSGSRARPGRPSAPPGHGTSTYSWFGSSSFATYRSGRPSPLTSRKVAPRPCEKPDASRPACDPDLAEAGAAVRRRSPRSGRGGRGRRRGWSGSRRASSAPCRTDGCSRRRRRPGGRRRSRPRRRRPCTSPDAVIPAARAPSVKVPLPLFQSSLIPFAVVTIKSGRPSPFRSAADAAVALHPKAGVGSRGHVAEVAVNVLEQLRARQPAVSLPPRSVGARSTS